MIRCVLLVGLATYLLSLSPSEACAHFLFAHVVRGIDPRIELHFAETAWDFSANDRMIAIMAPTTGLDGHHQSLTFETRPYALVTPLPAGSSQVTAELTYGLMTRGEPFLLEYHAKGVAGLDAAAAPSALQAEIIARRIDSDHLQLTVLFEGLPVPDAEVVVPGPHRSSQTLNTDKQGTVTIDQPTGPLFAIRAMVPEERSGVHEGKPYDRVRHYTTLTVHAADVIPADCDGLAWAVYHDALPPTRTNADPTWTGTFRVSTDGEVQQGSLHCDGATIVPDEPGMLDDHDHLTALAVIPHPAAAAATPIRLAEPRTVGTSARVAFPSLVREVEIRDRTIQSVYGDGSRGPQRTDIVEWSATADGQARPQSLVITDFNDQGGIEAVTLLSRTYDDSVHPPVVSRQDGRRIEGVSRILPVSVRLSEVRAGGPETTP